MTASTPAALPLPLRTTPPAARSAAPSPPAVVPRFTIDGDAELERHLARTCDRIAAGIRGLIPARTLEAVLLGGGYGRGEGGVLRTPSSDRPYNDLEFYVCLRGNRHLNEKRFGRALHVLGEILTPQAGIEVEFKIASLRELAAQPVSMFSYDLVVGHRWLVGAEPQLAACAHHRDASRIPLDEATRLAMNRCSGLLFARERLEQAEFTAADADFVRRNIAKAQLALGDAVLVVHGRYHWSAPTRQRELARLAMPEPLPWLDDVQRHHAEGVAFKLHPERSTASREILRAQHETVSALARTLWLWLESLRLGVAFGSPCAYALSPVEKCPRTRALRNAAITFRALGLRPLLSARATRHPRERIFHALALLLWEPAACASPELRRIIQRELQTAATTFPAAMPAYRALWARVN